MAENAGSIYSEVRLRLDDLKQDILKVKQNFDKVNEQAGKATKKSSSVFKELKGVLVGIGAIEFGRRLISGLKQVITLSSDAEETASKFGTVFKDALNDANVATKELVENYGLSSNASKKLLSDTGDLLSGFGFTGKAALDLSSEVQKLAVDLASFTNFSGGAEGASQALTKALLGERESVKSLGIAILEADVQAEILRQRQEGVTFASERQAKAYATLAIAQRQSKNAIGDFARTSDQLANRQRILAGRLEDSAIAFGKRFLPVTKSVVDLLIDLIGVDEDLNSVTDQLIDSQSEYTGIVKKLADEQSNLTKEERESLQIRKEVLALDIAEQIDELNSLYEKQSERVAFLNTKNKEQTELFKNLSTRIVESKEDTVSLTDAEKRLLGFTVANTSAAFGFAGASDSLNQTFVNRKVALRRMTKAQINAGKTSKQFTEEDKKLKDSLDAIARALNSGVVTEQQLIGLTPEIIKAVNARREAVVLEDKAREEASRRREEQSAKDAEEAKRKEEEAKAEAERQKALLELLENIALKKEEIGLREDELDALKLEREQQKSLAIAEGNQEAIEAVNEYYRLLADDTAYQQRLANEEILANETRALRKSLANDLIELSSIVTDSIIDNQDKETKEGRKKALVAFNIQKGIQVAQLLVSGIIRAQEAYAAAIAAYPVPPGLGPSIGTKRKIQIGVSTGVAATAALAKKPSFQFGGIVPGNRSEGIDSADVSATPGEMFLNDEQQAKLFDMINAGGGSGNVVIKIMVEPDKTLREWIFEGTKNQTQKIHANGLVALEDRL